MGLWARFFGLFSINRQTRRPNVSNVAMRREREDRAKIALANTENLTLVGEAISRLQAAGLRIGAGLSRDILIGRYLMDFAELHEGGDVKSYFLHEGRIAAGYTLECSVIFSFSCETNAFDGRDDLGEIFPHLAHLPDEEFDQLFASASLPIFENAATLYITNEHAPGEYLREKMGELEILGMHDFEIEDVLEIRRENNLMGEIILSNDSANKFNITKEKRPNISPLFVALNTVIAPLKKGRFVALFGESSETITAIYLRPDEQRAFRLWSESTKAPVDWFE